MTVFSLLNFYLRNRNEDAITFRELPMYQTDLRVNLVRQIESCNDKNRQINRAF